MKYRTTQLLIYRILTCHSCRHEEYSKTPVTLWNVEFTNLDQLAREPHNGGSGTPLNDGWTRYYEDNHWRAYCPACCSATALQEFVKTRCCQCNQKVWGHAAKETTTLCRSCEAKKLLAQTRVPLTVDEAKELIQDYRRIFK